MRVAVAHVAAVEQDAVVEHRAVAVGHLSEPGEELREHVGVIRLDLDQPILARLVVLVVRQRMERV